MNENTIIRTYRPSDNDSCIHAFESNVPKYFTEEERVDFKHYLDLIESKKISSRYFVIIKYNKVVGCGGYVTTNKPNTFALAWGFLHTDFHKKGLGEKLLLHRILEIKKRHQEFEIILDTTQHSFGFFEKFGFKIVKVTNDYYATDMHRYDMILA